MATISIIGGVEPVTEELQKSQNVKYEIYFGVFFDGTSNNMIQGKTARRIRRNHAKSGKKGLKKIISYGWAGDNRHKYENEVLDENELKNIETAIGSGSFKDGYEGIIDQEFSNTVLNKLNKTMVADGGFSNIAILFSKYKGKSIDSDNVKTIVYKIYVEGSGANDIKEWNTGLGTKGLGFGVSKTGVVALVSKAVSAVHSRLKIFSNVNINVRLHFDVFGFSRGAACARLFSYLVKRGKSDTLGKREVEFTKYYCKDVYKDNSKDLHKDKRLPFLDDYTYTTETEIKGKTKEVSFLGIFDTVVSIGMLRRRRKKGTSQSDKDSNNFLDKNNVINPLRAGFSLDRDFDENLHDLNVKEYGMYSPQLGVPTFHICAMDEFRENFALTDVGEKVPENSLELFLPGCHSDIGGGYLCNNEEKIVLNKYPTFSLEGLPLIKPEKGCAQVFIENPHFDVGKFMPLGLEAMRTLGWLPRVCEINTKKSPLFHDKAEVAFSNKCQDEQYDQIQNPNKQSENKESNKIQGTKDNKEGKLGEYEWWDRGDKIGWKRTVPSFFSNLPLHLMAERASIITDRCLFVDGSKYDSNNNKKFWEDGYYEIPKGLKHFYKEVKEKVKLDEDMGCRKWVFPNNNYSSPKYRILRLFYLHYTSEQTLNYTRIWDIQNATQINGYYNVISRIIYHGNIEDSGNMHYMFDYNKYIGDFDHNKSIGDFC